MNKILDIKALGPNDKLVIVVKELLDPKDFAKIAKQVDGFLNSKDKKSLVMDSRLGDLYILKNGAKILLKDTLNEEE